MRDTPIKMASAADTEFGDSVDQATFDQILEMDDDEEEREFSRGIVFGFFEQAEATFARMDKALLHKHLDELSGDGHFLKGSSATLGLTKVKDCCEKIQHYGQLKDENGDFGLTDSEALEKIKGELALVRKEYAIVEKKLKKFFGEEREGNQA